MPLSNEALAARNAVSERLVTCIHEAGHVVAARAFGFPVPWVSVDPNFIANDPLANENGQQWGSAVAMVIASDRLQPILDLGRITDWQDQMAIRDYCVEVFAGPEAERLLAPHAFDPEACEGDLAQVAALLRHIHRKPGERARLAKAYRQLARQFVRDNRHLILVMGTELHNRGTLMEADIDAVIAEHQRIPAAA